LWGGEFSLLFYDYYRAFGSIDDVLAFLSLDQWLQDDMLLLMKENEFHEWNEKLPDARRESRFSDI
jgi:hypothetical protein